MSQFPDTEATRLTELIMVRIKEHIKDSDLTNHHYNRVFEGVYSVLSQEPQLNKNMKLYPELAEKYMKDMP